MLPPMSIFFTVRSEDVTTGNVPTIWFSGTLPSGASILRVDHNPLLYPTTGWSCPQLWMSYAQLGLAQGEDIDALAIDLPRQRMLFSTRTATRNPVLFAYFGADLILVTEYQTATGTPVSTSIGLLQNDDVDAICAMDPSVQSTAPFNGTWFWAGTLRPQFFAAVPTMGGSAFRAFRGGSVFYDTWLIGWPTGVAAPGFAVLAATFGDAVAPVFTLGFFPRNPANPIAGDPKSYSLLVPPAVSLTGLRLTLRWFAIDVTAAPPLLAEAWPVQIRV
jgi:hypothetical protein